MNWQSILVVTIVILMVAAAIVIHHRSGNRCCDSGGRGPSDSSYCKGCPGCSKMSCCKK
ncbi:MAG: hypothetical protein IKP54_05210 [Bacteroidales bacterium]|nr:hypothetical protein [Bacteroidales bacterium]